MSQPDPSFSSFADLAAQVGATAVEFSQIALKFQSELNELAEAALLLAISQDKSARPLDN